MKTLSSLADKYTTQHQAACALGIQQCQLQRWLKLDALVTDSGEVFIKSKATIELATV